MYKYKIIKMFKYSRDDLYYMLLGYINEDIERIQETDEYSKAFCAYLNYLNSILTFKGGFLTTNMCLIDIIRQELKYVEHCPYYDDDLFNKIINNKDRFEVLTDVDIFNNVGILYREKD